MVNLKTKSIRLGPVWTYIAGVGLVVLITLLLSGIGAILMQNEYIDIKYAGILGMLIQFFSTFTGVFVASKMGPDNKIMICSVVAVAYIVVAVCCALLFFEGVSGTVIAGVISCGTGSVLGIFLDHKGKNGRKRAKRRKNTR